MKDIQWLESSDDELFKIVARESINILIRKEDKRSWKGSSSDSDIERISLKY